jgi:branched-chain amino acid transport system permease protein
MTAGRFYGLLALGLVLFPFVFRLPPLYGYSGLATEILIVGIAAIGFNLLLGYAGQLSYGHAAFYGLGAYGSGLTLVHFFPQIHSFALALIIGVAIAGVAAALIGSLVVRLYGIYFALLTVAFGQMVYFIVFQWRDLTNGDDGLQGISAPSLNFGFAQLDLTSTLPSLGLGPFGDLSDIKWWYVLAASIVFAVVAFVRQLTRSQFGEALAAIKDNEERSIFIGLDPRRYKLAVFIISGLLCGLAGALHSLYEGSAALDSLTVEESGDFAIFTIIGGAGTLIGPLAGTGLIMWLENIISGVTPAWRLIEGVLFVAVIVFLPRGIFGTLARTRARAFSLRRVLEAKAK